MHIFNFIESVINMLINKSTRIVGNRVILVPYKREHVLKYHSWMQNTELLRLTASQPLTLDEEYQMQQSWMMDDDKCTFIILDKEIFDKTCNETEAMIGDTNLFFNDSNKQKAEVEIMIAVPQTRGHGKGTEGITLMLHYAVQFLRVNEFVAKISFDNHISINLFKKLRFKVSDRSEAFQEVTMIRFVDQDYLKFLYDITQHCKIEKIPENI